MRGLLVALVVLLSTASVAEEPQGPRIRVEPESFDFGDVLPGRTVRREFRLRNVGDETLVIERISRSCGCTEASTGVSTLEPGESTALVVRLRTPHAPGPVEEQVVVRSSDPETPLLEIRLAATVVEK
jgi:hypothetical protein